MLRAMLQRGKTCTACPLLRPAPSGRWFHGRNTTAKRWLFRALNACAVPLLGFNLNKMA